MSLVYEITYSHAQSTLTHAYSRVHILADSLEHASQAAESLPVYLKGLKKPTVHDIHLLCQIDIDATQKI